MKEIPFHVICSVLLYSGSKHSTFLPSPLGMGLRPLASQRLASVCWLSGHQYDSSGTFPKRTPFSKHSGRFPSANQSKTFCQTSQATLTTRN